MYSYSPLFSNQNDIFGKFAIKQGPFNSIPYGFNSVNTDSIGGKTLPSSGLSAFNPFGYGVENFSAIPSYTSGEYTPYGQNYNPVGTNIYSPSSIGTIPFSYGFNPMSYFQQLYSPFLSDNSSTGFYTSPYIPYNGQSKVTNGYASFTSKLYDNESEFSYDCFSPYFDEGKVDVSFSTKGLKIRYKVDGGWSQEYFMVDMPLDVDLDKITAKASKGYLSIKLPRKTKVVETFRKVKVN